MYLGKLIGFDQQNSEIETETQIVLEHKINFQRKCTIPYTYKQKHRTFWCTYAETLKWK